jgi:pilus assembly protein CpaB
MAAKRYTLVFYAALVVALIATFGVYRVLEATKASSRVATAPVVVAAVEIQEGRLIDRASVTVAMWPVPTIPAGAYSSIDSVVNRVARINVFKGEPLVPGRLAPEGTSAGLEVKITPGKRAYSIRINDVSGIAGMIMPNSRVDILVMLNQAGELKQRMAKIFMSNMRILAIGPNVQRGSDGRPINSHVATLELTPEEVEKLAAAANNGSISLALRGYGDPDSITTNGATAADVVTMLRDAPEYKAPPPLRVARRPATAPRREPQVSSSSTAPPPPVVVAPPTPKPDTARVQIFRGSKVETKKFEKDSAIRDTTGTP